MVNVLGREYFAVGFKEGICMKLLIVGASGQLGTDLRSEWSHQGVDVVPVGFSGKNGMATLDIRDFDGVCRFVREVRPDGVINCSAYNNVDRAESDWENAFAVNALGPKYLAIACEQLGIPLMHFSTDYVFDGAKKTGYQVWDAIHPLSEYGKSKAFGEVQVKELCSRFFLVRTSRVFGPGNANFLQRALGWAKEKTELAFSQDGIASPSYTGDMARVLVWLWKTGCYGTYHLCNSGSCSRFEWMEYALGLVGWNGTLVAAQSSDFSPAAARPAFSILDCYPLASMGAPQMPHWKDATLRYLERIHAM